jgi:hypothetical protein
MTLKHRCLLTSGFTTLIFVAVLGSAGAAPSTGSSAGTQDRTRGVQLVQSQPVYDYYNYPVAAPVSPGCYLPSDGCLSEYSVQN